ncbi:MAG: hypothetical protein SGBAC_005278 [Bacillariaceae sp.]
MTFLDTFCNPQEFESETTCLTSIDPRKQRMNRWSTTTEAQKLDKELAAKMTSLSMEDREMILEELHGVETKKRSNVSSYSYNNDSTNNKNHENETNRKVSYTSESMHSLIDAMQNLQKHLVAMKEGTAYQQAQNDNSAYVSNIDFRLMFLRANSFDVKASAEQMIRYFEQKQLLFGKDKLTKDITINDLDSDDKDFLKQGSMQVLPNDTAGRQVNINLKGLGTPKSWQSELRVMFYIVMTMCDTEEKQKKGAVKVLYLVGDYRDQSKENHFQKHHHLFMAIPVNWKGIHVCNDDYKQYLLLSTVVRLAPPKKAANVRIHYGSHTECIYSMQSYGIMEGTIPLSALDYSPFFHHHQIWLHDRVVLDNKKDIKRLDKSVPKIERASSPSSQSFATGLSDFSMTDASDKILPRPGDMLFGKEYKLHPGNVQLRDIVTQHELEYDRIEGKKQKIDFVAHIVQEIQASGTRFLTFDEPTKKWKLVPITQARNKISKAIRNRRRTR